MTVLSRRYALLGLGDVALPSLLVAFLGRYGDARGERAWRLTATSAYAVGLLMAFAANEYVRAGQPALLYLVPATVGAGLCTALATGGREAFPELGVPSYYWGSNCLHASMFANCTTDGRCSTGFPSGPSWAAMWDRDAWRSMAAVVGKETRAAHPNKDVGVFLVLTAIIIAGFS